MAIVPLLLIRTKVMMAIRMSGIFLAQTVKAKTSLGLGQGSVVDIRTVMYEIKKLLKMKVSLRRKIHIMALPQRAFYGTCRNGLCHVLWACLPDATELQQKVQIIPGKQQSKKHQPNQKQEVPVKGT